MSRIGNYDIITNIDYGISIEEREEKKALEGRSISQLVLVLVISKITLGSKKMR
jgi:hypothetical protein